MKPRHFALLFAAYVVLLAVVDALAYLSLVPAGVNSIPYYDTIGHFLFFGLAGLLVHRAFDRRGWRLAGVPIPIGPLLVVLGAAAEEAVQVFSPVREACVSDWAADVAGIALFCLIDAACARRHRAVRAVTPEG